MAEYEVSTDRLSEAGDLIVSFADEMSTLRDELDSALAALPETLRDIRMRKQLSAEMEGLRSYVSKVGRALFEIAAVYANAERLAFAGGSLVPGRSSTQPAAAEAAQRIPRVRVSSSILASGELVMPDWLMVAVVKYMQSQSA